MACTPCFGITYTDDQSFDKCRHMVGIYDLILCEGFKIINLRLIHHPMNYLSIYHSYHHMHIYIDSI